jgi:DNA-binding Lrp family transcriptional regulator
MDSLDHQLIGLLRSNARSTVATLAHKLGVSRGTVKNRITKLEDDGVITGYTVRLKPDTEPNEIKAWTSIAVEGNQMRKVIAALLGEPGVAAVHDTKTQLGQVLERLRLIKGIGATETSIHLMTYKAS